MFTKICSTTTVFTMATGASLMKKHLKKLALRPHILNRPKPIYPNPPILDFIFTAANFCCGFLHNVAIALSDKGEIPAQTSGLIVSGKVCIIMAAWLNNINDQRQFCMDINKLQLERRRDQIWAQARKEMPLFEKFFNNEASEWEATQVAVIAIHLIATELRVYQDEIENISEQLLDIYMDDINSGFIDTLPFIKKQIRVIRKKIQDVGNTEETREEVEQTLENIRKNIVDIRLITLYNINRYKDIIFDLCVWQEGEPDFKKIVTEEQQAAIARCQVLAHLLLLLKDVEIQSLDGSWFK